MDSESPICEPTSESLPRPTDALLLLNYIIIIIIIINIIVIMLSSSGSSRCSTSIVIIIKCIIIIVIIIIIIISIVYRDMFRAPLFRPPSLFVVIVAFISLFF